MDLSFRRAFLLAGLLLSFSLLTSCDSPAGLDDGPDVEILSPQDGAVFAEGETIVFEGRGQDEEDGQLGQEGLFWGTTLEGRIIGQGERIERSDLQPGVHTIKLSGVNSRNAITEVTIQIAVGVPELVADSLRLTPGNLVTGETMDVEGSISNLGDVPAVSVDWRVVLLDDTGGDTTELVSGTLDSLRAGETVVEGIEATGVGPFQQGFHRVLLEVDPEGEIPEADEDNNRLEREFQVFEPGFEIDLRIVDEITESQEEIFESARERWDELIRGDLQSFFVDFEFGEDQCGGVEEVNEEVDDLLIFVEVVPIDGEGGVLARAGPCLIRTANNLPIVGIMQFDEADIDWLEEEGLLENVVLHEIAHVLGLGTLWPLEGLLVDPTAEGGANPHFVGPGARLAFDEAGGVDFSGSKVPVEDRLGPGPDAHWRLRVFENELMVGAIQSGGMPLSAVTALSLEDLGFAVAPDLADPYFLPGAGLREAARTTGVHLKDDVLEFPLVGIRPDGTLVPVARPPGGHHPSPRQER